MPTPTEPFLIDVSRDVYVKYVKEHGRRSEPVEGEHVAAMYNYDAKGNLIAIAFYTRTLAPYLALGGDTKVSASYRIRKIPVQEEAC